MFQIYANSYCNISATAAIDATTGLFFPRDSQYLWEDEINLNTDGLLRVQRYQKQAKLPRGYTPLVRRCEVFDLAFWDRRVESSPVNRRAWVLQERLLAPRVLHFCQDQIAWECPEHDAAESFPDGLPNFELRNGKIEQKVRLKGLLSYRLTESDFGEQVLIDPEQTSEMVHDHWNFVVERYSTTGLSYEADKLIALAGIAELMANRIGGKYLAGMWTRYLASQLTWRVKTAYENGRLLYPSRRPKTYRAPTFSWASVDAPQGVQFEATKRQRELHISVRRFETHPQTMSPFGPLSMPGNPHDTSEVCFVDIDCSMTPVTIELRDSEGNPAHHCKFWRELEGSYLEDAQEAAPLFIGRLLDHADVADRQRGSVGNNTDLDQVASLHEVPFHPTNSNTEQVQAGAGREASSANAQSTYDNDTTGQRERLVEYATRALKLRPPRIPYVEAKPTVGVYLDCPEDDGDELENPEAESYCVPASTNSVGDLICLLVQRERQSQKELYRRVGLLTFPAFLPGDQEVVLEQARRHQAQIRLI
ncbi:hypothetical protein M409DRAFT_55427 [Zasmidium cellare ATCC 36951]|uniref:Heterokaryon incompatibility domain-containing protein n=1 Tax=Zasmidium cellare ATCC 36951 TaxID=1080233 RepID=A0A6A6CFU9_ZASCE|nr:uncharacterized protein M409DRAFT_55427 [Zasmidium cellare ATCC 36951]KAF2166084.1 hypothetical protein M409DRAFT_55427 [Zasmidium cellare ATCC 36951]